MKLANLDRVFNYRDRLSVIEEHLSILQNPAVDISGSARISGQSNRYLSIDLVPSFKERLLQTAIDQLRDERAVIFAELTALGVDLNDEPSTTPSTAKETTT